MYVLFCIEINCLSLIDLQPMSFQAPKKMSKQVEHENIGTKSQDMSKIMAMFSSKFNKILYLRVLMRWK